MYQGKYKVKTLNHISPVCREVLTDDRYEMRLLRAEKTET